MRRLLASFLLLLATFSGAAAKPKAPRTGTQVQFDHSKAQWFCNERWSNGCAIEVREGETVTVSVVNTVPGLFSVEIKEELQEPPGISGAIAGTLGLATTGSSAAGGAGPPGTPLAAPALAIAYPELLAAISGLQRALLTDGFAGFDAAVARLKKARADLFSALVTLKVPPNSVDADAALAKLKEKQVPLGMTESDFKTIWDELTRLLATTTPIISRGPSANFTYEDRDFHIIVVIKPLSALIKNPELTSTAVVRLKNAWKVAITSGFSVSGLRDDHYTTKTETTSTGSVKKAVKESEDMPAAPEATLFVHLHPSWSRNAFSAGLGIAADASGRLYVGYSRLMGGAGAFTFGVAGGKVKRLSRSVNVDDLGGVDPEATRRDVYRGSVMAGFSWTLSGK